MIKVFLSILVMSIFIFAADNVEDDSSMDLDLGELFNIVLETGSFLETDLKNSPLSMTIIDREDIAISSSTRLSELLEIYVPGFYVMYNKWVGEIWSLRGVASDINNKFIILINGRKMNVETRDGTIALMYANITNEIDRVEVLRGPAGLVYGSGAMAGVINIVTKSDVAEDYILATINHSSTTTTTSIFGGYNFSNGIEASGYFNYRISRGIGEENSKVMGFASWNNAQWVDTYHYDGLQATDGYGVIPFDFAGGITLNYDDFSLFIRHDNYDFRSAGLFPDDPYPAIEAEDEDGMLKYLEDNGISSDTNNTYYEQESQMSAWGENRRGYKTDNTTYDLSYNHEFKSKDKVKSYVNFTTFNEKVYYQDIARYTETPGDTVEQFGEQRLTLNSMYLLNRIDKFNAAAGVEVKFNWLGKDINGINSSGGSSTKPVLENDTTINIALFGEAKYDFTDWFTTEAGIRVDKHRKTKWIPSPKVSLLFNLYQEQFFKLIYQSSSNSPKADQYGYTQYSLDDDGNPYDTPHFEDPTRLPDVETEVLPAITREQLDSLKPEMSYSFEGIIVNTFKNGLELENSIGYNTYKDAFIWEQSQYRVLNGGVYHTGQWEGEFRWASLNDKWNVGINHSYSRVVNTDYRDEATKFYTPNYDKSGTDWYKNAGTADDPNYVPVANGSEMDTGEVNSVKNNVTVDNKNFLNMPSNITKLYLTYHPIPKLVLHTDNQFFWKPLAGREDIYNNQSNYESDISFDNTNIELLDITDSKIPVFKSHFSLSYIPSNQISVTFGIKNAFSDINSKYRFMQRNTLRHQVMVEPGDQDLYTTDTRTFYGKIDMVF